ncbi:MAG: hypothetical protein IPM38_05850 [Ignavibacteria bacterium]|nr:hypothetical protein [Ignavibacteria bacterium]
MLLQKPTHHSQLGVNYDRAGSDADEIIHEEKKYIKERIQKSGYKILQQIVWGCPQAGFKFRKTFGFFVNHNGSFTYHGSPDNETDR